MHQLRSSRKLAWLWKQGWRIYPSRRSNQPRRLELARRNYLVLIWSQLRIWRWRSDGLVEGFWMKGGVWIARCGLWRILWISSRLFGRCLSWLRARNAGLRRPSCVLCIRLFVLIPSSRSIGCCSENDWDYFLIVLSVGSYIEEIGDCCL